MGEESEYRMTYKSEIVMALSRVNEMLKNKGLTANLTIVGGAALILNGIEAIETMYIDTCITLQNDVKDIFNDCSIDINDDAREYIENYRNLEFIDDEYTQFSNIAVQYLAIGGVIATKMKDTNPDKLNNLAYVLNEELNVPLTIEGISNWFDENDTPYDINDIENFLQEIDY